MKAFLIFFVLLSAYAQACQCPPTKLSLEECDKYEIIFKGKIVSVKDCGNKFGEAIFEVEELYKGNATKQFEVLFECQVACAQQFYAGDEWIIYSKYKQLENAMMDWCSRSRKYIKNEKEDFYTLNYGNDYDDEVKFLREKLGNHRLLLQTTTRVEERNKLPNTNEIILILISSIAAIILFYFLFNKLVK